MKNEFGASIDLSAPFENIALRKQIISLNKSGIQGILLGCSGNFPKLSYREIKELKKIFAETGMKLFQFHPIWPDIASENLRERNRALDYFKASIDIALELESPAIIIHPGGSEKNLEDESERNKVKSRNIESLIILSDYSGKEKLCLCLENMAENVHGQAYKKRFGSKPDELLDILKKVNNPNLGICFDSSHAMGSKIDPVEFINNAASKIMAVHLHDTRGWVDEHLALGEGAINWAKLFAALERADFKGPLVFEMKEIKAIENSISFVKA